MGMLQYRKTCETLHLQTQTLENPEKRKQLKLKKSFLRISYLLMWKTEKLKISILYIEYQLNLAHMRDNRKNTENILLEYYINVDSHAFLH